MPADVYGRIFYGDMVGDTREKDSEQLCREKYPLMRQTIKATIEGQGRSVAELVEQLRRVRRDDGDLGPSQAGTPAFDKAEDTGVRGM